MSAPLGIWLPECAYYEGLDELMAESGLRYAVLDGHGLLNADPRPRYGLYAPICTRKGVVFFLAEIVNQLFQYGQQGTAILAIQATENFIGTWAGIYQ